MLHLVLQLAESLGLVAGALVTSPIDVQIG